MRGTVCAVIVTYNRKHLLKECLEAVLSQTRSPDHILVVDNASTDGTMEMLRNDFPQVEVLHLKNNLGGAGGFYEGMKRAYAMGFEWLWLMDDDGCPAHNCLQVLLNSKPEWSFKGCLVLSKEYDGHTAFSYPLPNNSVTKITRDLNLIKSKWHNGWIKDYIAPFNGCLLHRKVIDDIGFPIKEFFIWGDEVEYFLRAKSYGIQLGTIMDAIFYHPIERKKFKKIGMGKLLMHLPYTEDDNRLYLIIRNQLYVLWRYESPLKAIIKTGMYAFVIPEKMHILKKAVIDCVKLLRNRK